MDPSPFGRHATERTQSSWPWRSASRCVASLAPPPRSRDGGFGGAARRMNANGACGSASIRPVRPFWWGSIRGSIRATRQTRAVLSCDALASNRPGERSLPLSATTPGFEPSTSAFASASLASSTKARSRTQSECPSSVAACSASTSTTQLCSASVAATLLTSQRCSRTSPSAHPTAAMTRAAPAPGSHASAADVGVALRVVVVVQTTRKACGCWGGPSPMPVRRSGAARGDAGRARPGPRATS